MGCSRHKSKVSLLTYDELNLVVHHSSSYLAVDSDMDTFVRGVRLALRVARSEPLVDRLLLKDDAEESESIYFPGDANPDRVYIIIVPVPRAC